MGSRIEGAAPACATCDDTGIVTVSDGREVFETDCPDCTIEGAANEALEHPLDSCDRSQANLLYEDGNGPGAGHDLGGEGGS
jgi:hypothetical protein